MTLYQLAIIAAVSIWGGSVALCSAIYGVSLVSKSVERSVFGEGGRPTR